MSLMAVVVHRMTIKYWVSKRGARNNLERDMERIVECRRNRVEQHKVEQHEVERRVKRKVEHKVGHKMEHHVELWLWNVKIQSATPKNYQVLK